MSNILRDHLLDAAREGTKIFVKDIQAMSHELLNTSPGGSARKPYDFIYEVAMVNRRMAKRILSEELPPMDFTKWTVAPDEYCDKDAAIAEVEASIEAVTKAFESLSEEQLSAPIATPRGDTTAIEAFSLVARHVMYHDAQLNYVQAMNNDTDIHWF